MTMLSMILVIVGVISVLLEMLCLAILCHNKIRLGHKLTFLGQILAFIGTFILSDYLEFSTKRQVSQKGLFTVKKEGPFNFQVGPQETWGSQEELGRLQVTEVNRKRGIVTFSQVEDLPSLKRGK